MILLIEQELPHYRAPVFAALNESLAGDLVVCYGQPLATSDHTTVNEDLLPFKHLKVKTLWIAKGKLYVQNLFRMFPLVGSSDVVIMRDSSRSLSLYVLVCYCKLRGIPVVLWGQAYSRYRAFDPQKNLVDKIHLLRVWLADAYACYTKEIRDELAKYVPESKLFVATNTLNTRQMLPFRDRLVAEGKENVKQRLGLERKHYLSFVGRLQPRKQIPYLLDVYKILKRGYHLDIGLLIIGKGSQEPLLREQVAANGLDDVHFLGFMPLEEAGEYLLASDVMVIPGWLGLAVNHAFMFGLPVVSQLFGENLRSHAPEASFVRHGVTGWFSDTGDKEAMARGISHILDNLETFSANVLEYAEKHLGIENMIKGFTDAISYAKRQVQRG